MDESAFLGLFAGVFVVLGVCVLVTYVWFWRYYLLQNSAEQNRIWAFWGGRPQVFPWGFSAAFSAVGFICFSIEIMKDYKHFYIEGDIPWLITSYTGFLVTSALYTPLMMLGWHKGVVIVDLLLVSVSVIALCAWTWSHMRLSYWFEGFIMVLILILAVHCTLWDLIVWGWTWYHWPENKQTQVDPKKIQAGGASTDLNERLPWPSISNYDVSLSRVSTLGRPPPPRLRV
jgi:hypothetical protein